MIFDRHANLKYKYGNRKFWCRGFYVDTVGRNQKRIEEYIRNQLQEDVIADQASIGIARMVPSQLTATSASQVQAINLSSLTKKVARKEVSAIEHYPDMVQQGMMAESGLSGRPDYGRAQAVFPKIHLGTHCI